MVAKDHFFSQFKQKEFAEKVKEGSKGETLKLDDSIVIFNRDFYKKKDANLVTVPGSFLKVKALGGVAQRDSDKINQLNRRSVTTMTLSLFHAYILTEFLYQNKLYSYLRIGQ